jgi:hypothetical protein
MSIDSQQFDSFVPVYDVVPEPWEEARPFLVEILKKISNAVNIRTIGWLLDEELLSGQAFIPGITIPGNNPGQFRQVLRKVIDVSPLAIGLNTYAHGITVDTNFTLIDMWVAATNPAIPEARVITGNDVSIGPVNISITSPAAYTRAFCFIEYIQEL